MKNLFKIFSLFSLFICHHFDAQEIIKNDTLAGTPLSIIIDSRINDALEDMENNCKKTTNKLTNSSDNSTSGKTPTRILVPNRELTNAEICRKNPRIMGAKIQLVVVKSNEEANEVKAYFRRRFPRIKVETDASLRPNYKILAGSYFSKQSASDDLSKIRQYFKSAITVNYMVFCAEAK